MANCYGYIPHKDEVVQPVRYSVAKVKELFLDTNKIQSVAYEFLKFAKSQDFDIETFLVAVDNIYGEFNNKDLLKYWTSHHACVAYSSINEIQVLALPSLETLLLGFQHAEQDYRLSSEEVKNDPLLFARKLANLVRNSQWKEIK